MARKKIKIICLECEGTQSVTEDGYCFGCGNHADKVAKISEVTGYPECPECYNEELNGWSSHCNNCGMPIVY